MSHDIDDLQGWDAKILELVDAYGLDCFPQEFEVCDHHEMIAYMAYSGMPAHYPHWSYGKSYEKTKTLYDYAVSGLPYEMVINSDPSLAYLMADNSLCLNVLTIAHVYGHNDFFKNNFTFRTTRPEYTLATFKSHADRVRSYVEDPSIGLARVEPVLDAAHAIALQCRRNLSVRKLSPREQAGQRFEASLPRKDPHRSIHPQQDYNPPDLRKTPLEPEEDLLLFIREYNPYLDDWEKDLLTIVHEEAQYLLPQIETKIMNEGWASYWHYQIMTRLDCPENMRLEFMIHHNQVLQPHVGGLNSYHLGYKIWESIYAEKEGDGAPDHSRATEGREALFQVRETDRDRSFLRRFLTKEVARELGLFEYTNRRGDLVVSEVSDDDGWEKIKDDLVRSVGAGSIPVIKIHDADYEGKRALLLTHDFDGRELNLEYAEKTLMYLHGLWGREITLETTLAGKPTQLVFTDEGLTTKRQ